MSLKPLTTLSLVIPRVAYAYKTSSVIPKRYLVAANQPFFYTEFLEQAKPLSQRCYLTQSNKAKQVKT